MKKQIILKLIELYCYVSTIYDSRLAYSVQSFSNNCSPKFTLKVLGTTPSFLKSGCQCVNLTSAFSKNV